MPELSWKTIVQVGGGTTLTAVANPVSVEGIDTVEVVLEPDGSEKVVEIQPADAADIELLVIKSSLYGKDLVYKANDGGDEDSETEITLDAPQVFSRGNVDLFKVAPRRLKFKNKSSDKKATVMVFVARDATP